MLADPDYVGLIPDNLSFEAAAPTLCAGVTVYKRILETEARAGELLVVSGFGGLDHMAVQYGKAMGMNVVAVDISDEKLALAKELGAEHTINALNVDPVAAVQKLGGAQGVLVTAVDKKPFEQAVGMLARGETMSLVGLPLQDFSLSIFDTVLNRKTIRGSIVGTRNDLTESLKFAAEGKVAVHYTTETLNDVNSVLERMKKGKIDGRVVLKI